MKVLYLASLLFLTTFSRNTESVHLTSKDLEHVARFTENNQERSLRLKRQAISNPQQWYGPIGLDRALDVPIPTNIGHFPGGNRTISDVCPREKVEMASDGSCESPLTQGKCEFNEEVILDPETTRGICVPRLCPPNRVFVHTTQLCHDPLDMYICPPGRELYYSAHGTPVCSCPDGTIEGDDDLDDDVCELVLGSSMLCMPGQVFWFRDFSSPPACLPDPCNGQNLRRSTNGLPFVPSETGECIQLGSSAGVCPENKYFSLSYKSLTGKCVTLEEAGYVVLDTSTTGQLKDYFATSEASGGVDIYAKVNISNKGEGLRFPEQPQNENFDDFRRGHAFRNNPSPIFSQNTDLNNFNQIRPAPTPAFDQNTGRATADAHDNTRRTNAFASSFSDTPSFHGPSSFRSNSVAHVGSSSPSNQFSSPDILNHQGSDQNNANIGSSQNKSPNSDFNESGGSQNNFVVGQHRQSNPTQVHNPSIGNIEHNQKTNFASNSNSQGGSFNVNSQQNQQFGSNPFVNRNQNAFSMEQQFPQTNDDLFSNQNFNSGSFASGFGQSFAPNRHNFPNQLSTINSQRSQVIRNEHHVSSNDPSDRFNTNQNSQFQKPAVDNQFGGQHQNRNQFQNQGTQFHTQFGNNQQNNGHSFGQRQPNFGNNHHQNFHQQNPGNQQHSHHQPISIETGGPGFNSPEVFGPGGNNQQSIELFDPYYGLRLSRSLGVEETPVRARLTAQWQLDTNGRVTNSMFHSIKKRASLNDALDEGWKKSLSDSSIKVLSRRKRDTLPYASPSNVFETRLLGCKPGSVRDINAKCRNTILPARIPKRRGTRGAPPIPPTPSCGANMAFNIRRMCVPSSTAQRSIVAFNLG